MNQDELALAVMDDDGSGCAITHTPYQPVTDALESQRGGMKPGTEGWWRVWGACAMDIRTGDLVMTGWKGEQHIAHRQHTVGDPAPWGDLRDSCRRRFMDPVTGEPFSVGMLQPVGILRRGTHYTLSDYAR